MKVIYEPKGRAKEYSDLALNIYAGCFHGCKYCYAPVCLKKDREEFHKGVSVRKDLFKNLAKDLIDMETLKDNRRVLLCFTCDPYQALPHINITRRVLKLFNNYNINFNILTKNGILAISDFDLYKPGDVFSVSMSFLDNHYSKKYEPLAPLPRTRILSLLEAKKKGIETWVSIEPVIIPGEALEVIYETHNIVDGYKIGKVNNFDTGIEVDWREFTLKAINLLKSLNFNNYYIKNSLQKYLYPYELAKLPQNKEVEKCALNVENRYCILMQGEK